MKIFAILILFLVFLSAFASGIDNTETAQPADAAPVPAATEDNNA